MQRPLKKDWVLNEDAFNRLLGCFDADRQRAGEQYEHLRRSLIKYFNWRGSIYPEKDADETIDRVALKLYEGPEIEDLYSYALGVACLVVLESLRSQEKEQKTIEQLPLPSKNFEQDDESGRQVPCFDACLAKLPADKRELIVSYYQGRNGQRLPAANSRLNNSGFRSAA